MRPATLAAILTGVLALALAACAPPVLELEFTDHVEAGLIEQDVYVEKPPGSGGVYRMNPDELEAYKGTRVYGSARTIRHSPFNPAHNGPYRKGRPLGMTMGEWLAGSGSATYSCWNDEARIEAWFRNLVPYSTYTMWYAFVGKGHMGCPDCPFASIDFPVGDPDGSQSIFKTDAVGGALYALAFEPCLKLSDERLAAMLTITYHSDGRTHGPSPGPFGRDSHLHLFAILPEE